MIIKVKYSDIDFEKYSSCIESSDQRKYSATKLFLDITTNKNWEVLIYNDYEAVMPIPFVKKFGIRIVVNPKLCQQLGIFSKTDRKEINNLFLNYLEKKYNIWYYAFNDTNEFSPDLKKRKNFIIYPSNYEEVRQKYSPKRKRKLRLDEEVLNKSTVKEATMAEAYSFIFNNFIGAKNESDKEKFIKIFSSFDNENCLKIMVFVYHEIIINAIVLYTDDKTLALLGTFNNKDFVKLSGSSILIDDVIKKNIKNKTFDFEGSEIPAIEEFFRGFRPELKMYSALVNSKIEVIKKVLKFF